MRKGAKEETSRRFCSISRGSSGGAEVVEMEGRI